MAGLVGCCARVQSNQVAAATLQVAGMVQAGRHGTTDTVHHCSVSSVPAQHVADVHDEAARERVHPSPCHTIRANLQAVPGNRARSWECLRELPPCEPTACHAACMLRNTLTCGVLSKARAHLQPWNAVRGQQGQHACKRDKDKRMMVTTSCSGQHRLPRPAPPWSFCNGLQPPAHRNLCVLQQRTGHPPRCCARRCTGSSSMGCG